MVASLDNVRGLTLAMSSSAFIGSSFVIKKIGLKKAGDSGARARAGSGGHSYLYEPLWWLGMVTMILGEIANFAAYAFAPAILVTPLGALSIIFSAVLAHFILKERLHMFGVVGCILCVVGSVGIVLHAPKEREINSVEEIWHFATQPGFIVYSCVAVVGALFLIFWAVKRSGHRKMLVYIAICSLMGSLTVISVKAVAIALKLSFSESNQFIYVQTWFFIFVVIICCLVQLNYLNKASMIRHTDAKASSQRDYLPPFFGPPTSSARRDEVGLRACSPSTPAAESSCECLMRLAVTPSAVSHTGELVSWMEAC
ncbi:probable magnesium transporter NIPA2 isoform X5 [Triticum aestivum]|uniref:probable magnesium transporter NIPA2 isoform X5 n=1 Tax=Triticum aestivum TaxID=4565 RepID=UPI001D006B32|nr:probable magnesium transporter NIPA2 isoform X5 [Triticum aestivum]